jgi:hypothetical protein
MKFDSMNDYFHWEVLAIASRYWVSVLKNIQYETIYIACSLFHDRPLGSGSGRRVRV